MLSMKTKSIALLFIIVLVFTSLPLYTLSVSAATLTQSQFDSKLAAAEKKYPDGYQKYEWKVDGTVVGWECHGYARWLSWYVWGVDFANGRGDDWKLYKSSSSSTYIDKLIPGDVVRYRSSTDNKYNHSIFITSISGNTIYFTDCNSDGANTIKWNRSMTKSTLTKYLKIALYGDEAATYGYIAHYTPNTLNTKNILSIKYDANGGIISGSEITYNKYEVVESAGINLRSGAGTSYSVLNTIPYGETFVVTSTKTANGYTWGKTTYSDNTGWCVISEEWTKKIGTQHATTYYLNSSEIVYKSSISAVLVQKLTEGETHSNGLYNYTTFGLSRTGYKFIGWGTTASGGTVYDQNTAMAAEDVYPSITSGDATITLYAIWEPHKLEIRYNANGGYIPETDSPTYYIDSEQLLCKTTTQAYHISNWSYGKTYVGGLVNDTTFGIIKDDYIFKGWSFNKDGGTIYDKNSDRIPEELYPDLKNSSKVITLYAVWELNIFIGDIDKDGIISAYDLINLRKILCGNYLNDYTTLACDLTEDGQIDIRDLVCLKKELI